MRSTRSLRRGDISLGATYLRGAREFVRRVLGKRLDEVTAQARPANRSILTSVASMLWIDLALPYLREDGAVPNREYIFKIASKRCSVDARSEELYQTRSDFPKKEGRCQEKVLL